MSTVITINNVSTLIEPIKMGITKSDLYSDSSTRSAETGDLMLYLIRSDCYSLAMEFVGTATEISAVETAIGSSAEFLVSFSDMGTTVSRYMYASDRVKETLGTPTSRKYRLSFNLIETRRSS